MYIYIQYIFRIGVFEDFFGFLPSPRAGSQLPWVDSDHQDRQAGWIQLFCRESGAPPSYKWVIGDISIGNHGKMWI